MKAIFVVVVLTVLYLVGMVQLEHYRDVLKFNLPSNMSSQGLVSNLPNLNSTANSQNSFKIQIYGQVQAPKTLTVNNGTSLSQVLTLVGGTLATADSQAYNINYLVKAGDVIYIPAKSTKPKVSLNTATVSQLDELPGIGNVYAQRIIEYREANGEFMAIEEIKNVGGIGSTIFDKIKDLICL